MQQVKLTKTEGELEFALSGEIDAATSEDFYAQVMAGYMHDKKNVVFDCALLTFIDSTTLGTFVKIFKKLSGEGYKMTIKHLRPNVKKLFDICALNTVMEILP